MRHAKEEDLQQVAVLLAELRNEPLLRERRPGYFSRGSRAFLHFHVEGSDFYVDVKLGSGFERLKVTSPEEQANLISRVQSSLQTLT